MKITEPTKKQVKLFEAFQSGKYFKYVLGGGAGSGKTQGIIRIIHNLCKYVPNVRILIGRLSDRVIRESLIPSYKKGALYVGDDVSFVDKICRYSHKGQPDSEVHCRWFDITKDPDCQNVLGGEWTGIWFNEFPQISQKYINLAPSRIGRWNSTYIDNKKVFIKPFMFLDCNPHNGYAKTDYYDRFQDGTLPGNVYMQLSTYKDNLKYLPPEYIEMLESLPPEEYKRFALNDWNYGDDPNQLIKYESVRNCIIDEYEPNDDITRYMGVDVARYGDDETWFIYMEGNVVVDADFYKGIDTTRTAHKVMQELDERKIGADKTGIDEIGMGAGVIDPLVNKGYGVASFNSAEKPAEHTHPFFKFANKRAEAYWLLAEDVRNGDIQFIVNTKTQKILDMITQIQYFDKNGKLYIESKDDIKKRLQRSPDPVDALAIANYVRHYSGMTLEIGAESGIFEMEEESAFPIKF